MKVSTSPRRGAWLGLLIGLPLAGAQAADTGQAASSVRAEWVKADVEALAGDALQGRGSATADEAKAADYVASRFREFGLVPAPGMSGYLQTATVVQPKLGKAPVLSVGGAEVKGAAFLLLPRQAVRGRLTLAPSADPSAFPQGEVVAVGAADAPLFPTIMAAKARGAKLVLLRESDETKQIRRRRGGAPSMSAYLEGGAEDMPAVVTLPASAFVKLIAQAGREVVLALPGMVETRGTTTNAIGYLPGSDPAAGILLLSAHLDHLGRRPDGVIMHGANDDASGVAAVIELARALASGPRSRRGILFVCYGAEEMGGFGSSYFGAHPPVPLTRIAANIEFEMIGVQDPKLPRGSLMVTGYERSDLAETLSAHGALLAPDPYPEQHFFQRSDNYQLALRGVVAHTISGWPTTPVYHQASDTVANLDIPFMTRAIQSLIEPVRWLASSDFQPEWKKGGRPER